MVWPMIIGAIAAGASAYGSSSAAEEGADIRAGSSLYGAQRSADVQRTMFEEGQEATQPWREAGESALDQLRSAYGISGSDSG